MKEVIDWYELVEGTRIQTTTDLDIVSSQQSHRCSVLLLKHLPLQRGAQQQEVVVCKEQERKGQSDKRNYKRFFKVKRGEKQRKVDLQNMKEGLGLMAKSGR